MTKLQALRDLLEKATAAPWRWDDNREEIMCRTDGIVVAGGSVGYENARLCIDPADAALIAALRNSADALLDVVEAAVAWRDSGWQLGRKDLEVALAKLEELP